MLDVPASAVSPALAAEIALRHYGVVGPAERLASEFDDTFRLVGGDGVGLAAEGQARIPPRRWLAGGVSDGAAAAPGRGRAVAAGAAGCRGARRAARDHAPLARAAGADDLVAGRAAARGGGPTSAGLRRDIGADPGPAERRPARVRAPRRGPDPPLGPAELRGAAAAAGRAAGRRARAGWRSAWTGSTPSSRPRLAGVATQVIHTDFHGENLLTDGARVTGILDFGDALTGPVAMDVGVAACYQLGAGGPGGDLLAPALDVVAGVPRGRPAVWRGPAPRRGVHGGPGRGADHPEPGARRPRSGQRRLSAAPDACRHRALRGAARDRDGRDRPPPGARPASWRWHQ